MIYRDLGDFNQAKEYQQRALAIRLEKLGPVHVDVATSYSELALIYMGLGDFDEAEGYQQRALDIRQEKLGPEHVEVATNCNTLALTDKDVGDFEQVNACRQPALPIRLEKLCPKRTFPALAIGHGSRAVLMNVSWRGQGYQPRALAIRADKHSRNKTPNKVRTANRRKKLYYGNRCLERFYVVFKGYRVGTVSLKFAKI